MCDVKGKRSQRSRKAMVGCDNGTFGTVQSWPKLGFMKMEITWIEAILALNSEDKP